MCIRQNCHPHNVDKSRDKGGDKLPGPTPTSLEMDPQTAADSNAARIFFPEEHPREPPRRLILLGPKAPREKSSTTQLVYSSTRS